MSSEHDSPCRNTHTLRTANGTISPLSPKCDAQIYFICLHAYSHTKLDKVIILQYIIDGVIRVQQTQTLAPAHNKTSVLHSRDAAVVWFVLHVTFERLFSEPPDIPGGISAGHCQPLISDVDSKTRHCASTGLCCRSALLLSALQGTTFSRRKFRYQSGAALGATPHRCHTLDH